MRRRSPRAPTGLALAALLTSVFPSLPLQAQEGRPAPGAGAAGEAAAGGSQGGRRGPTDRAELEAFLDGVMAAQMREKHVAGATVAVVRDGALLLAKGYGFADVDARAPVDPARTLFRIGSVTKLFTWTAVMQLAEAGQLDLDADVQHYLDFELPDDYAEPITLRHILTHTPGFEEDSRDLFSEDPEDLQPLGEWLESHVPGRVRPPGTFSSYSNYATALAGYVVERVSGMTFDDYVDRRILEPLDMRHTTTRQPLPEALAPDMSEGYAWRNARFEAEPFEIIIGAAPAGSISASAEDMATFMLAHLGEGAVGERRILSAETARTMHRRHFGHDDRLNGFALGFYEKSWGDLRVIGHGGDTGWFHTDLALLPSEELGVFVSYNTQSGGELSFGPFLDVFMAHYYPLPAPPAAPGEEAREAAERAAGEYAFNRRSYTTFQKAFGLAQSVTIGAGDDGSLVLHSPLGAMRFVPVEPLLYREALGQQRLSFREDDDGTVTHAFLGLTPMMALERVPWYEAGNLHRGLLVLALLIFLGTAVAAVPRWWRGRRGLALPGDDLSGRGVLIAMALVNVAFLVVLVVLVSDISAVMSGPLTGLKIALALPVVGLLLTLAAGVLAVRHWIRGSGTAAARLRYGVVVLTGLLFAWSLHVWNLLGWRM